MLRYLFIGSCFVLTACSAVFDSKPVSKLPLAISDPAPLKLDPVHFSVITERNQAAFFNNLRKNKKSPVFFALTENDYKSLAIDIQRIKDYLILEKNILNKYRNYYEGK